MFRLIANKSKKIAHLLMLLCLLATPAAGEDELPRYASTLTEAIASGDALRVELHKTLRGLKYPQTINTEAVSPDTELLDSMTRHLLRWKADLEAVLLRVSASGSAALDGRRKAYLINLYFGLLASLLQMKQIIVQRIDWRTAGEQFTLTVPLELAWSRSKILSRLFAQQVQVDHAMDEGQARLRLKHAFVDGLQVATLILYSSRANHLAAIKYLTYGKLYSQLVQNEHYRGTRTEQLPELPSEIDTGYGLGLRESIIAEQRRTRADQFLFAALLEALPLLKVPDTGIQQPLLSNWHLYEQLQAAHPDMTVFTTQLLAQQIYALLDDKQRTAVAVNDVEEMYRFMLLAEQLYLPLVLEKELRRVTLPLDGSEAAGRALQQLLIQARFSALLNALAPLRLRRDKIRPLLASLQERQAVLLAVTDTQEVTRWYEAARKLVPDLKQRTRSELIREVLYAAWKVDTAEHDDNEPLNLQVLRRSLLRSLYVTDFSGEFQQSLAAVLQAKGYGQSRAVFFGELARHLQRLTPQQSPQAGTLRLMGQDDIVRTYVNPSLAKARARELESGKEYERSDAAHAVQRKTMLHNITQVKALLQHGYWFGYFTNKGDAVPSLDDLPLSAQQRANYWRELRFARFDQYPFLLLPVVASKDKPLPAEGVSAEAYVEKKQPLYKVLAAKLRARDLHNISNEEIANFWPLVAEALDTQRQRIVVALQKIDAADSVQDIKHLAANSPAIAAGMKEISVLYPRHEKFAHRYHQPSKLQHSWERIDLTYIGNFFTVVIGWHLGGWLLRKSVPTSYLLRYLNPAFGAILPYTNTLMMAFWYVILFDYFGLKPWQTFVSKPRKLDALQEYYYLGNQRDQFVNRTYLDYLNMEKTSHIFNYAFEAAMLGLFVGWAAYNHLLPHLVPNIKNARLQRLFSKVGFRGAGGKPLSEAEVFERRHEIFNRTEINKKMAKEITKVDKALQAGRISKSYARQEKHQIELARDKIFTSMAKKERAIKVAEIEHTHDFRALGLSQPVFRAEEIHEAYSNLTRSLHGNKDLFSNFALRDADTALLNIQMSLMRRLKFQIIRSRADMRAKISELSAEHSRELEMFGIAPNRKDTFSQQQLKKIEAEINRRFPTAQQVDTNHRYLKFQDAYNSIYLATEELEAFRIADGWHSAMFEAIIDSRFGHAGLHSEAELVHLEKALQLLEIDLTDSRVSSAETSSGKMPTIKLATEWEKVVAEQHQKVVAEYRDKLDDVELQELNTAKELLLRSGQSSTLQALLMRARYENFYRILGLDPKLADTYDNRAIKKAHNKLAVLYHPDHHQSKPQEVIDDFERKFKEVSQAYKYLQEPATKGRIDAFLNQYLHGEGL